METRILDRIKIEGDVPAWVIQRTIYMIRDAKKMLAVEDISLDELQIKVVRTGTGSTQVRLISEQTDVRHTFHRAGRRWHLSPDTDIFIDGVAEGQVDWSEVDEDLRIKLLALTGRQPWKAAAAGTSAAAGEQRSQSTGSIDIKKNTVIRV